MGLKGTKGATARLVALLVALACVAPVFSQTPAAGDLTDEDRELLGAALQLWQTEATSALIDSTVSICPGDRGALCLRRDTVMSRNLGLEYLDASGLRERFLARNDQSHAIGQLMPEPRRVARERVTPMFSPGGLQWSAVQRAFQGVRTLTQVSAPGYSVDGGQALVFIETLCSPRCSHAGLLLFDRKSEKWGTPRTIRQWME